MANERFGFTMFVSICLHVVLILGVGFGIYEKAKSSSSVEITLAQYRSNETPQEADFLAQENQLGSGSQEEKRRQVRLYNHVSVMTSSRT